MSAGRDLLIEVGTEELPPKALADLMAAFGSGIAGGLARERLDHDGVRAFATPRRLAVIVSALADKQPDRALRLKGPPVSVAFDRSGSATRAATAFAAKCGTSVDALGRERGDGGEWLVFDTVEAGQSATALVPGILQKALDDLPVPRRMRWGSSEAEFVRPVHWLVVLCGDEPVPCEVLGIRAGRTTFGHRFHAPAGIELGSPADYESALLERGRVVADFAARRARIVAGVAAAAEAAGGAPVGGDALYDEVTALTEWPVAVTGHFDDAFLALPREVIVATLTGHQRYFPVAGADGGLLPVFITLANLESREPERVRDGNERVIRPRLADAAFFWRVDREVPLGDRTASLHKVVYQQGLGSLHDKSLRVAALTRLLAQSAGIADSEVTRAAVLAKCDLMTGLVGEFPELQGTMGRYYAEASGEAPAVCVAIGEQYLPRFSGDRLPASRAGQVLAVADKLDTLAGIFALGRRPSGNRDPFGLRRAALGVIRILVEAPLDIDLRVAVKAAVVQQPVSGDSQGAVAEALMEFLLDRLRSYLVEDGGRYSADMFDAVRAREPASLVDFDSRMAAVATFVELEPAASLAAANKRTANILRQADADDGSDVSALDASLLVDDAERVLYHAMSAAAGEVAPLLAARAYGDALARLAELRVPVDAFFDGVMVMTDDAALRANRLALLRELRALFFGVADLSRLTPAQE